MTERSGNGGSVIGRGPLKETRVWRTLKTRYLCNQLWLHTKQVNHQSTYNRNKNNQSQLLLGIRQSESTFFRNTQIATVLQRLFVVLMICSHLHLSQKQQNKEYEKAFGNIVSTDASSSFCFRAWSGKDFIR